MPADRRAPAAAAAVGLMRAVAAGDQAALEQVYDAYAGPLYGYGYRRLGSHQLAEELVQRVMTKLWRLAHRYDAGRGSLRTWVFTIARTACVDLAVTRAREREAAGERVPEREDERVADELDMLLRAEVVRAARERLSPEHQAMIELAYYEGLTQAEIAARLGLPLGTVKSRTYYALKALRLTLDELGVHA